MKHEREFYQLYRVSPLSPTGIFNKKTGKPAGYKNKSGYWCLSGRVGYKSYHWQIPRVLIEHHTKLTLPNNIKVCFIDNNKDNLKTHNLMMKTVQKR